MGIDAAEAFVEDTDLSARSLLLHQFEPPFEDCSVSRLTRLKLDEGRSAVALQYEHSTPPGGCEKTNPDYVETTVAREATGGLHLVDGGHGERFLALRDLCRKVGQPVPARLTLEPPSVRDKSRNVAGGPLNDYVSLAKYWWPVTKADGTVAYESRDGSVNPECYEEHFDYLRFTGRDEERVDLVERYMKEQGLFHTPDTPEAEYSDTLTLDLSTVEPSIAGPKRPQDRISLSDAKHSFQSAMPNLSGGRVSQAKTGVTEPQGGGVATQTPEVAVQGKDYTLTDGDVVIAAITSCTNTSNPSVMLGAALVARSWRDASRPPHPPTEGPLGRRLQALLTDGMVLAAAALMPVLVFLLPYAAGGDGAPAEPEVAKKR